MTSSELWRSARRHRKDMIAFLRDLIAITGESRQEEAVIKRIKREMSAAGFDEIIIDKMGNIRGRIGRRKTVVAMDAHIDTVGVGSPDQWKWDPYRGKFPRGIIYGRGVAPSPAPIAIGAPSPPKIRGEGARGYGSGGTDSTWLGNCPFGWPGHCVTSPLPLWGRVRVRGPENRTSST